MRIRYAIVAFAVLLLFPAAVAAQQVFFFPQVGDGSAGSIQFQTTLIFINTGPDTMITVDFFATGNGAPLNVTLGDLGTANSFDIPLAAGESISLQTPGEGGIIVGYARITVPEGASVGGTGVFTRTHIPTDTILYEAGVPASSDLNEFTLFVDTIGNRDTGLAIVNTERDSPAGGSNEVQMRLFDLEFNEIATTVVPLPGGAHSARFVAQIFDAVPQAAEMEGSLAVSSPDDLAAVTLRQNDEPGVGFPDEVPTLTAFPVVPGSAAAAAGFSAAVSTKAGDSKELTLTFPEGRQPPRGALLMFHHAGRLVHAEHRSFSDPRASGARLALPAIDFDQVEVQLLFADGKALPGFIVPR